MCEYQSEIRWDKVNGVWTKSKPYIETQTQTKPDYDTKPKHTKNMDLMKFKFVRDVVYNNEPEPTRKQPKKKNAKMNKSILRSSNKTKQQKPPASPRTPDSTRKGWGGLKPYFNSSSKKISDYFKPVGMKTFKGISSSNESRISGTKYFNKVMSSNLSCHINTPACQNQPMTAKDVPHMPETATEPANPTNKESRNQLLIDQNKLDQAPPELDGGTEDHRNF